MTTLGDGVGAPEAKTSLSPTWEATADLVVVGTGVAGLTAALCGRELGLSVLVVTKAAITDSNTRWAQGGVAVVDLATGDSVADHVADTLAAGGGLCEEDVVGSIVAGGPAAVARLRARGTVFDRAADGSLARTREGGHSAFRVIHAGGDATGAEVERALAAGVSRQRVPVLERHIAVDTLRTPTGCVGGLVLLDPDGTPGVVRARAVLLATGGFGQLYQATSNPEIATGDGLALALRAGAAAADLEFVQFHPTVLYTKGARGRCPLVTEAVRGEGAVLVDAAGQRVMAGVHPLGDLAPRDVVSAAITRWTAAAGVDHVYLDATGIDGFARRFPTVHAACARVGVDPAREPIPVTPAAHFACGGVATSPEGRTGVPGLYAAGEVARTGLHGANRLASNSLLEGLVVGERAAEAVAMDLAAGELAPLTRATPGDAAVSAPIADRGLVQRLMSRHAAIGRDAEGLSGAATRIAAARRERVLDSHRAVEDAALTLLADALLVAAAERTESRGCHVRTDFAERDDVQWQRSLRVRLDASGAPAVLAPALASGAA
ncbi:L-aspartate oxidase [Haloechinothrix halophila]|uniref:L-aspartate oxidase n=1 Tax=Haloechinothrix halophila TaxID=1069073 RepID=UPI000402528D|nr:L-aspartate oxidase [Haloechinothrix halophila]